MMEVIAYIVVGLVIGLVIGWLIFKLQSGSKVATAVADKERAYNDLDKDFAGHKAKAEEKEKTMRCTCQRCRRTLIRSGMS